MKSSAHVVAATLFTVAAVAGIHFLAGLIGSTYERVAINALLYAAISRFLNED